MNPEIPGRDRKLPLGVCLLEVVDLSGAAYHSHYTYPHVMIPLEEQSRNVPRLNHGQRPKAVEIGWFSTSLLRVLSIEKERQGNQKGTIAMFRVEHEASRLKTQHAEEFPHSLPALPNPP